MPCSYIVDPAKQEIQDSRNAAALENWITSFRFAKNAVVLVFLAL